MTLTVYTISKPTEILEYLQLTNTNLFRELDITYVMNQLINVSLFLLLDIFKREIRRGTLL